MAETDASMFGDHAGPRRRRRDHRGGEREQARQRAGASSRSPGAPRTRRRADVPPEALDVARTMVRRGIQSDAIYQSYRRGQQVAWQRWMACARGGRRAGPGPRRRPRRSRCGLLFEYVDQVLGRVVAEMQREREEILGGALAGGPRQSG